MNLLTEPFVIVTVTVVMLITSFVAILPILPGPALVWAIAMIYGVLTNFTVVSPLTAIVITLLMIIGSTTEFWTPIFGMRVRGASCSSIAGTLVGGLAGTFLIPVPIFGTLLGAVGGAVALELLRLGDLQKAFRAGSFAFESYLWSVVLEIGFSFLIVIIFSISAWTWRP